MTRRFEFIGGNSAKFYEVSCIMTGTVMRDVPPLTTLSEHYPSDLTDVLVSRAVLSASI